MIRGKVLAVSLIAASVLGLPAFAETTKVDDLKNTTTREVPAVNKNDYSQKDWVYKSLNNLGKKYGLVFGNINDKSSASKPLTRNEAAVLLVNLVGKIEQDKVTLSESEKERIEVLKEELGSELEKLTQKVNDIDTSVKTLEGRVSSVEKSDSKNFKASIGKDWGLGGDIVLKYNGNLRKGADDYSSNFELWDTDLSMWGNLAPHVDYNVGVTLNTPLKGDGSPVYDAFIKSDIIPKHNIYAGQMIVPIGQEGTQSSVALDTIDKAQIARNIGSKRDIGLKLRGDLDFMEYYLGAFNGQGANHADKSRDMSLASWVIFKPLYKMPKYGSLQLGGGYYTGSSKLDDLSDVNKNSLGLYASYKYKKYTIKGEFANQNGYDDVVSQRARGWYATNLYDLTNKIQLVAKVDGFDPNIHSDNDRIMEYTLGTNYFMRDNNLKFQFDYVHVDNKLLKDSDRIMVLSQYLF